MGFSEECAQKGAYHISDRMESHCDRGDSWNISEIRKKEDKPGIDILIDGDTKGERVFIPVVVSVSGMTDLVDNDFYVADGADVTIVAGCGIHNSGCNESRHDGIHTFHVGENANVKYEEKHYGEGNGAGSRVLNPVRQILRLAGIRYLLWTLHRLKVWTLLCVRRMLNWQRVQNSMYWRS